MKIERFNVGWITSAAVLWRQGEDPEARIRFPIPAYLVETDNERILIDTGLHPGAVRDAAQHYSQPAALAMFELEQEQDIAEQIDVTTLTKVVLTHLHFDHAGGLSLIPASVPVVLQRREWQAGGEAGAVQRNFFQPLDYATRDREVVLVDGDHDLLGDGSVELLSTPGHTPGHQSVRLGARLVLGADVTHYVSTLDDRRFPSFADDHAAQGRSADRLSALRGAGAEIVPGHDAAVLAPGPVSVPPQ